MDYEGKDALDNKRRVMKSSIFGDSPDPVVVSDYQPKYPSTDNRTSYNDTYNTPATNYPSSDSYTSDNYQFSTQIAQPATYQSQSSNSFTPQYQPGPSYQPKQSIAPSMIDDTPIRIPKIEKIEQPPPLPSLTPFPEFRFDTPTPIGQLDLGIRPREPKPQSNPANAGQKTLYFSAGDALQRIRNDLMQEAANCNNRMQKIMTHNDDLQINNVDVLNMQRKPDLMQTTQAFENEPPQFTTSTQFMLPDGTTINPA